VLHDAVPSAIRSGVASGVSSLSWFAFLPVALGFGALSTAHGVREAGWLLVALAVLAGTLLAATARCTQPCEARPVGAVGEVGEVADEPVPAPVH
jgi:Na+/melibiose symporter-like transporter